MHYSLPHPGQGVLGPALAIYASQSTTIPSAFSTMLQQDPTWYMDTGASSHLNFNASNLSTIFYKRLFPYVRVGDGKSIPVTNTGHNIIPSHHRLLHLHNVLLERSLSSFQAVNFSYCFSLDKCFHAASTPRTPGPTGINMVRSMWLFKHKFHADGTLSRYKARLVANGSSQQLGVDFDETFILVVKRPPFTRSLALSCLVSGTYTNLMLRMLFLTVTYLRLLGSQVAYLLIYVDDIILIASSPALLQQIIDSLHNEFDMTDLRALNYFFGIFTDRNSIGLFLSQKKYDIQLLERAHMVHCNPSRTPVDTKSKLGLDSVTVQDPTLYRSLAGGYSILHIHVQICLMLFSRFLYASATTSLVGYTDADWAGCPSTRMYTLGYCVFLGDNLLSWSAKHQHTLSRSSAEAESRGVPNVVAETAWLRYLLHELHSPLSTATLVYCDNVSAVYMSANPVQHQRTKHIEIDIHFVRDMVTAGQVRVLHVPSRYQWNECYDNEDELQSFRHKARQQDKVYDEREESCWILHLCTGIFYLKGHEGVMNEVPDGAAIFASSYWLRNSDMYRV
ncbi:ribonuclease H-like domain-containing protein [Tanacetum coccineum]